jgi:cytidylate kinase
MTAQPNGELLVFEYNGSARSGKGTIVKHLCEVHPQTVTVEETGVDYRAITRFLLANSLISLDMSSAEIGETVASMNFEELKGIVQDGQATLKLAGSEGLYDEPINKLVAEIGQVPLARKAVKTSFVQRVEKIRDEGQFESLLLDGRNLAPVINGLDNVTLRLRTFVDCSAVEAARRECARKGIDPNSAEGKTVLDNLSNRIQTDAMRTEDPVKPDVDAVDFANPPEDVNSVASFAVENSLQIYFDTTALGKNEMLSAAEKMFSEARLSSSLGMEIKQ